MVINNLNTFNLTTKWWIHKWCHTWNIKNKLDFMVNKIIIEVVVVTEDQIKENNTTNKIKINLVVVNNFNNNNNNKVDLYSSNSLNKLSKVLKLTLQEHQWPCHYNLHHSYNSNNHNSNNNHHINNILINHITTIKNHHQVEEVTRKDIIRTKVDKMK